MDYTLVRSNRKTVAIQLQKDGRVVVRAPKRLAVYRIEAFVKEKQGWIEQHQKRLQEQQSQKESFCLSDGQFPLDASDADDQREDALLAASGRFFAGG